MLKVEETEVNEVLTRTWVGNHDDDAVRTVFDNLGDDVLEDVDISLDQFQPALPLLLTDSGCHQHDVRVCCHRII